MQVQQFKRLAQMADKVFDRAFNKALEVQKREEEKAQARRPPTQQEIEAAEQKALREEAMPMSTRDAIKRMMLADKDKDYFRQEMPVVKCTAQRDGMGAHVFMITAHDTVCNFKFACL